MSLKNPRPNANFVPEYQISGVPYVTASAAGEVTSQNVPIRLDFPEVTRWVVVQNTSATANLRFGFTENGVKGHEASPGPSTTRNYFIVTASSSTPRMELRCKSLYFTKDANGSSSFNIIAGLTRIRSDVFPILTGSTSGSVARVILGGVG